MSIVIRASQSKIGRQGFDSGMVLTKRTRRTHNRLKYSTLRED